jgi:hypothetical protein
MIAITVDLIPGGLQERRRTIGTMRIANISELANISDYAVHVIEGANPLTRTPPRNGSCVIRDHDRRQSVWSLVAKAAQAALEAEFDEL